MVKPAISARLLLGIGGAGAAFVAGWALHAPPQAQVFSNQYFLKILFYGFMAQQAITQI